MEKLGVAFGVVGWMWAAVACASALSPTADVQADFDAYEWGVVVFSHRDTQIKSAPTNNPDTSQDAPTIYGYPVRNVGPLAAEPVILIRSRDGKPIDVAVTLSGGDFTDIEPSGNRHVNRLEWKGVVPESVQSASYLDHLPKDVTFSSAAALGAPQLPIPEAGGPKNLVLQDAQATPEAPLSPRAQTFMRLDQQDSPWLTVGATKHRFLFYEGTVGLEPCIQVGQDASGRVLLTNRSEYPVYGVMFSGNRYCGTFAQLVATSLVDQLAPGETATLDFDANKTIPFPTLTALGFSTSESDMFRDFWSDEIRPKCEPMHSTGDGQYKIFYRLDPDALEDVSTLEFHPKPKKLVRAIYALQE